MKLNYLISILLIVFTSTSFAHSGRTDASGCHNDRKNGGYHCHNSKDAGPVNAREVSSEEENYEVMFNQKSHIYHRVRCKSAKACTVNCTKIKKSEAISRGGRACGNCGG